MSTWIDSTATCPECGQTTPARIATSVHIVRVPEVRATVFDRSINRITCAGCRRRIAIDAAFTYVDVERGHWVQVEPGARRADWRNVEQIAMGALTRGLDLTSPLITDLAATARRRLVFGTEELREKLTVWNAGIDDGLLECIKLRAAIDDTSLLNARLIADRVTEDGGLELVRVDVDRDEAPRRYAVPVSWVDRALDEQPSLRVRFPELFGGGFVSTLKLLAVALLFLVACSHPSTREPPPPPRAKDAIPAVPRDAEVQEPDAPADAVPPVDAPFKVRWDDLRRREISANSVQVAAEIVHIKVNGTESVVVFDRGKYAAVREGWKGQMIDAHDHAASPAFTISSVDTTTCTALVTATVDWLKTHERAVLWDPANAYGPW